MVNAILLKFSRKRGPHRIGCSTEVTNAWAKDFFDQALLQDFVTPLGCYSSISASLIDAGGTGSDVPCGRGASFSNG